MQRFYMHRTTNDMHYMFNNSIRSAPPRILCRWTVSIKHSTNSVLRSWVSLALVLRRLAMSWLGWQYAFRFHNVSRSFRSNYARVVVNTSSSQLAETKQTKRISHFNASAKCQYTRWPCCHSRLPIPRLSNADIFSTSLHVLFFVFVRDCLLDLCVVYSRDNKRKYSPFDMCIFFIGTRVGHYNEVRDSDENTFVESNWKQRNNNSSSNSALNQKKCCSKSFGSWMLLLQNTMHVTQYVEN